jgi:hypothetical protein
MSISPEVETVTESSESVETMPSEGATEPTEKEESPVKLTEVPDDDIIAFASSKCRTCLGRGRLSVKRAGEELPRILVCQCAVRRFVAANRDRLTMGSNRKLFYQEISEGLGGSPTPEPETEADADLGGLGQFKTKYDRVKIIDEELAEIDARYDQQLVSLAANCEKAKKSLEVGEGKRRRAIQRRFAVQQDIKSKAELIAHHESIIQMARLELVDLSDNLVALDEQIAQEDVLLLPYEKAVRLATDEVELHNKRRQQTKKPYLQRRESLLKRMSHKAASLGMSMDEVISRLDGKTTGNA